MAKSIESRLLAAQVAIDNALNNADIKAYLAQYGYEGARLNEGKALLAAAQQLHQKQKAEYGDQFATTTALQSAWEQANNEYMRCVKIARVALKSDRGVRQKLALDGKRKVAIPG
jgi:LAS superfamily LD-carboxypeptidase LdcB